MKNLILVLLIILNLSCSNINKNTFKFKPIECKPEAMPKYDYRATVEIEMTPQIDSALRIEKRRTIFKPCRAMIYKAVFKSEKGTLISDSRIKLMAKGQRWEFQPEKQDVISIQYEFTQKEFDENKIHQLNKGIMQEHWIGEVTEGVIENVEQVWMHPFRFNQYNFTEVAPFPEIEFPLRIGKTWSGNLNIQQGWGDWENTYTQSEYKITAKEAIETAFGKMKNCWKVESKSVFELGESTFDYWFNEELGFVKMNYKNYGNQTLQIELVDVQEN